MQTQSRRASDITAEAESVVRGGAVRVKAVGSGHTETEVRVDTDTWLCGAGDSVVFQLRAPPVASWWVVRARNFTCHRVTQSQTRRRRLARCFVQNGDSSTYIAALATDSARSRIPVRTHIVLPARSTTNVRVTNQTHGIVAFDVATPARY